MNTSQKSSFWHSLWQSGALSAGMLCPSPVIALPRTKSRWIQAGTILIFVLGVSIQSLFLMPLELCGGNAWVGFLGINVDHSSLTSTPLHPLGSIIAEAQNWLRKHFSWNTNFSNTLFHSCYLHHCLFWTGVEGICTVECLLGTK